MFLVLQWEVPQRSMAEERGGEMLKVGKPVLTGREQWNGPGSSGKVRQDTSL